MPRSSSQSFPSIAHRLLGLFLEGGWILTEGTRDLCHVVARPAQKRVEEHVLDQEGVVFPDPVFVVAAIGKEIDQVSEPVVGRAGGAVLRAYGVDIGALVLWDLLRPEVRPLHYLIPHRGVVHPRLPRMADVYEPLPPGPCRSRGTRARP